MDLNLAVVYADVTGFPAGSAVANIVATITGSDGVAHSQTVPAGTASVTFPAVAADTYAVSVAGVDASGATLGTPATGSITITAPATVTLSLPSTVTATQA